MAKEIFDQVKVTICLDCLNLLPVHTAQSSTHVIVLQIIFSLALEVTWFNSPPTKFTDSPRLIFKLRFLNEETESGEIVSLFCIICFEDMQYDYYSSAWISMPAKLWQIFDDFLRISAWKIKMAVITWQVFRLKLSCLSKTCFCGSTTTRKGSRCILSFRNTLQAQKLWLFWAFWLRFFLDSGLAIFVCIENIPQGLVR